MEDKKSGVVVQVPTANANIGPIGFHIYASEFLRAKQQLKVPERFSPVPYYLTCRALELAGKAFLLARGASVRFVKDRIGHDLGKLLVEMNKAGLVDLVRISSAQEQEIERANEYYSSKGFEYFQLVNAMHAYPDLPDLRVLVSLVADLLKKIEPLCSRA